MRRRIGGKSLLIGSAVLLAVVLVGVVGAFVFSGSKSVGGFELDRQSVNAEACPLGEVSVETVLTSAEVGTAYFYAQGDLVVRQVIPKCGVLVGGPLPLSPAILILTKRTYIDGAGLRPGLYACIGTAQYPNKDGFVKTVLAFEEAEPKVAQQRAADLAKQKAEEDLKRQKIAEEARLEREAQARAEREAAAEAEIQAAKLKAETEAKLAKMRAEEEAAKEQRRAEAEKQAKEAKAKADAAAAEGAKKRYPVEQKMRAEYAASKLSAIKFELKEYFIIEKSLLSSLKSASVTEDAWRQMKAASKKQDWLGVLSVAAGEPLKDYPDTEEIDRMLASIIEREFHVEFKWNGSRESHMFRYGVFSENGGLEYGICFNNIITFFTQNQIDCPAIADSSQTSDTVFGRHRRTIVRSSYKNKGKILVYSDTDKMRDCVERYRDFCSECDKAVELGKIEQDKASQKKHDAFVKFKKEVLSIMSRDGFKANGDTISLESDSSSDEETGNRPSAGFGSGSSYRTSTPAKKKREIDPSLKTFRGPKRVW